MTAHVLRLFAAVLCLVFSLGSQASSDDEYQVIILDGESLPQALGYEIEQLSLAAVKDGVVEPIPYQIDEYNIGGAIYFDGWDVDLAGTADIMDAEDKLLFLVKDAGPKRSNQPYDGEFLAEIRVNDPSKRGAYRYAYLVKGSRLRSDEQYVRYTYEAARVETDFYDLSYDKDNHLIWETFNIFSFEGDQSPFDTMKIRLNAGVLSSIAEVELTNKNVIGKPKGERIGPIRTTTQLELTLWMLEIPLMSASLQLHHYPKSLVYDMRMMTPEFRRSLIVDPSAAVSLDGNNLIGGRVITAAGPPEGAPIDGKMTEAEQKLLDAGFTPEQNWLLTKTEKNLDVIAFFDFLGSSDEPLSVVLTDDAEVVDEPERFKGQLANFGVQINNMPKSGLLGFVVSLYVDDQFEGATSTFTRKLRTLPEIQVREI